MLGFSSVVAFGSLSIGSSTVFAQEGFAREWQVQAGSTALASFVRYDEASKQVTLKLVNNGQEKTFSVESLTEADQAYVFLQRTIREDRDQFEKVSSISKVFVRRPILRSSS